MCLETYLLLLLFLLLLLSEVRWQKRSHSPFFEGCNYFLLLLLFSSFLLLWLFFRDRFQKISPSKGISSSSSFPNLFFPRVPDIFSPSLPLPSSGSPLKRPSEGFSQFSSAVPFLGGSSCWALEILAEGRCVLKNQATYCRKTLNFIYKTLHKLSEHFGNVGF